MEVNMDYMNWYEKCLWLARLKQNGGELSELERSELERNSECHNCSIDNIYGRNVDILPA